jgi:hypothetical protein
LCLWFKSSDVKDRQCHGWLRTMHTLAEAMKAMSKTS